MGLGNKLRQHEISRIAELYAQGYTMPEIGEIVGRSVGSVSNALAAAGVQRRRRGQRDPDRFVALQLASDDPEFAFDGEWVQVGMVKKPVQAMRPADPPDLGGRPSGVTFCGTERGYQAHRHRGEDCETCKAAHAAHNWFRQQMARETRRAS